MSDRANATKERLVKGKKKAKLGSGKRFDALRAKLAGRSGVTDPDALAASIGREKLGRERFQALAAAGRRRAK